MMFLAGFSKCGPFFIDKIDKRNLLNIAYTALK